LRSWRCSHDPGELVDRELHAMLATPDAVDEELWAMLDDDDDGGVEVLT
jgi:hypothetical protein